MQQAQHQNSQTNKNVLRKIPRIQKTGNGFQLLLAEVKACGSTSAQQTTSRRKQNMTLRGKCAMSSHRLVSLRWAAATKTHALVNGTAEKTHLPSQRLTHLTFRKSKKRQKFQQAISLAASKTLSATHLKVMRVLNVLHQRFGNVAAARG